MLVRPGSVGRIGQPSRTGLSFAIDATGAQIRAAIATPTSWGETLGPELVSNGTFDSGTTGWTAGGSPTVTVGANGATVQNGGAVSGYLSQPFTTISGRVYRVAGAIVYGGSGFARIEHGNAISSPGGSLINVTASGAYSYTFTATATTTYVIAGNRSDANASHSYDNISVREVVTGWLLPGLGGARLSGDCRTSVAMQTEADGTVGYAAHNLVTYSEDLSNAAWTAERGSISANAAIAPNSALTADKYVEDSSTGYHRTAISPTLVVGVRYTTSIYAKASGRRYLVMNSDATLGARSIFDLQSGTVNVIGGSGEIVDAGSGWYRCSVSGVCVATGQQYIGTNTSSVDGPYTGDGTSGVFLWGAQLNLGPTATAYVPTTTAAVYAPAIDWLSGIGAYGLRSEPAATNLVTYSTQFDDAAWVKTRCTVSANVAVAPDGTTTADKLVVTSASGTHKLYQGISKAASALTYTLSVFVKAADAAPYDGVRLQIADVNESNLSFATYNASTGVADAATNLGFTNASSASSSVGNGWYRFTLTATTDTSTTVTAFVGSSTSAAGDDASGFFVWGAQLEAGSIATSPILTYGAAATRAADTLNVLDSGWINQTEGTLVADWIIPATTGTRTAWHLTDGGSADRLIVQASAGGTTRHLGFISSVAQIVLDISSAPSGSSVKDAFAYKAGAYAASRGGSAPITSTFASVPPAPNVLRLGHDATSNHLDGHLTRIRYSRRRANDGTLRSLTT